MLILAITWILFNRSPLVNWAAYELNLPLTMGDLNSNPHPFRQIPCLTDDRNVLGENILAYENISCTILATIDISVINSIAKLLLRLHLQSYLISNFTFPTIKSLHNFISLVFESGAILNYLNSKVEENTDDDSDLESRNAAITSWISWANASLDPICFLETPEGKVYDTGLKKPNKRIDILDSILGENDFLVNGKFSLADVSVASYLLYVPQFFGDVDLSRWPNVVRYMKTCVSREGYSQAFGSQVQQSLIKSLDSMGGGEKKLFGIF